MLKTKQKEPQGTLLAIILATAWWAHVGSLPISCKPPPARKEQTPKALTPKTLLLTQLYNPPAA